MQNELRENLINKLEEYLEYHDYTRAAALLAEAVDGLQVSAKSSDVTHGCFVNPSNLYADYTITLTVGGTEIAVNGWYCCGWVAKGASMNWDGSPLARWGDNQPGDWTWCDSDARVSGAITVSQDKGSPWLIVLRGGYNEYDVEIDLLDILGLHKELADRVVETLVYEPKIIPRIREAIAAAKPECEEPSDQEIFDQLDELADLPGVRVGHFETSPAVFVGVERGSGLVVERVHTPDDVSYAFMQKIQEYVKDVLSTAIAKRLKEVEEG